jgi:pimeloyl-ACP methyl ester carboxylesterase
MTAFVLVPGADGQAWYWHLLVPELQRRGHSATAGDLPKAGTSTLADYADALVAAARSTSGEQSSGEVVLVAQSMGAFSAPLACDRLPVRALVLLNPMIPTPGETGNDWWANTGQAEARAAAAAEHGWPAEFDLQTGFFHDVPAEVTELAFAADAEQAALDTVFTEPWPLPAWPDLPTRVVQGRDDRLFPLGFQRRVAAERLGLTDVHPIDGGHLAALSRPAAVAAALLDSLDLHVS